MLHDKSPANPGGLESDVPADSPEEFLQYLNPQASQWEWPANRPAWLFRGQGDATWALRPTVLRDRDALAEFGVPLAGDSVSHLDEALRESVMIFERGLYEAGLPLPRLPETGGGVFVTHSPYVGVFYADEILLMTRARHHGLPTIILDWSTRAYVATYFAVTARLEAEAKGDKTLSSRMAVWALDASKNGFGERGRLSLHRAPGWTNPNMLAQSGRFTHLRADDADPCKNTVDGFVAGEKAAGRAEPLLRRVTVDAKHARVLLRRLAFEGVTGATMFPGADGVVRAMREEALWTK